ncbi:MAG: hypothetical protein Q8N53_07430, partial [Longimicrobiales bacterium]|nr:hypothetical protein [Longimicrobiales bacterium]
MTRTALLVAVAALLPFAAPLEAQLPEGRVIGARLRVTDARGQAITGALVLTAPDGMILLRVSGSRFDSIPSVPIGLIVGLVNVQEIWEDVGVGQEVPPKPALRVAPMPGGGFSLAASI